MSGLLWKRSVYVVKLVMLKKKSDWSFMEKMDLCTQKIGDIGLVTVYAVKILHLRTTNMSVLVML